MSDSDAEFEKFLQESLSSSSASYQSFLSELSRSHGMGSGVGGRGSLSRQWWGAASEGSDVELEAAGQSWLKSNTTLGGTGRQALHVTLPSVAENKTAASFGADYTRDSLEGSGVKGGFPDESRPSSETSYQSEDCQDASKTSVPESSPVPGLDTLEEGEDKKRFFSNLEGSRGSPLDYSELNRQLGETGQSSLTLREQEESHSTEDLEKTPVPSDNEEENVPHISTRKEALVTPLSLRTSSTSTPPPSTPSLKSEHRASPSSPIHTDLSASATSIRSTPLHQSVAPSKGNPDEQTGFSLSPIHKGSDMDHSSKGHMLDASSLLTDNTGGHTGNQSEHRGFLLSPIHTTDLTASSHFKKASMKPQISSKLQQPSHKLDSISLSPIHVKTPGTEASKSRKSDSSGTKHKLEPKSYESVTLSPLHTTTHMRENEGVTDVKSVHHSKTAVQIHMPSADPSHPLISSQRTNPPDRLVSSQTIDPSHHPPVSSQTIDPSHHPPVSSQTIDPSLHPPVGSQKMDSKVPTPNAHTTSPVTDSEVAGEDSSLKQAPLKAALESSAQPTSAPEVSAMNEHSLTMVTERGAHFSEGGLENDLAELQSALEAAGLPRLGENITSCSDQAPHTSGVLSGRQGGGGKLQEKAMTDITDTIRTIAAEELASLTKEILLQGLEKEDMPRHKTTPIQPPEPPSQHSVVEQQTQGTPASSKPSMKTLPSATGLREREETVVEPHSTDHFLPSDEHQSMEQAGFDLSPIHVTTGGWLELPSKTNSEMKQKPSLAKTQVKQRGRREGGRQVGTKTAVRKPPLVATRSVRAGAPSTPLPSSAGAKSTPQSSVKSPGFSKLAPSSSRLPVRAKSPVRTSRRIARSKLDREQATMLPVKGEAPLIWTSSGSSLRSGVERSAVQKSGALETESSRDCANSEDERGNTLPSVDHRLQAEVTKWRQAWQEKKGCCEDLAAELASKVREKEGERKDEKDEHSREVEELRGEVFALNAKLREVESTRWQLAQRGERATITQEEQSALRKEIQEQETLLQGYQKENERLYHDLAVSQKEMKSARTHLHQENQRLTTELMNTRSQLERQLHRANVASLQLGREGEEEGGGGVARARIAQLEERLEEAQEKYRETENQVKQLKHSVHCYEGEVRALKQERKEAELRAAGMVGQEEVQLMKDRHKEEVNALNRKLQWYAENQHLLDRECETMRKKDRDIAALREKLAAMQTSSGPRSVRGRAVEARRVQQLERQVKELEEVIRRRFPNSLSALILASGRMAEKEGSAEGGTEEGVSGGVSSSPSVSQLQSRICQLECDLESRDEENKKRIRALQQKYSKMEMLYEQQVSCLKEQLEHISTPSPPPTSTSDHQMEGMEHGRKRGIREEKEKEKEEERQSQSEGEVHFLRPQLEQLQTQNAKLAAENTRLQSELEQMRRERGGSGEGGGKSYYTAEWQGREAENRALREKVSSLHFELAHQRVQLQGKLAEAEGTIRQLKEEAEEKVSLLCEEHKSKVDALVARFAREHAASEVTRLQSKVSAMEATIVHLREQLELAHVDAELLSASRGRERQLSEQLKALTEELLQAKKHHTPEMQHFQALLARISSLEARSAEYESRMREHWQTSQNPSPEQLKELEQKWRRQLSAKNAEIQHFREELDYLLNALDVLQHGTVTSS